MRKMEGVFCVFEVCTMRVPGSNEIVMFVYAPYPPQFQLPRRLITNQPSRSRRHGVLK